MTETEAPSEPRAFAGRVTLAVLGAVAAISAVGRFFVPSALWLDEALSVNISRLPIGDIGDALRHDGHPPLYYLLLHGWIALVGDGDHAVRALSGLITLATVPLAFLVGRRIAGTRLGWTLALVFLVSPYAFRYGSETRMYALVMAEVFAGYLFVDAATSSPRVRTLAGVSATTGLLLWTHYWSMWLIAAVVLLTAAAAVRARRRGDHPGMITSVKIVAAVGVGGLTFLPWLPTLLYQNEHTGTPWAPSFRISGLVVSSLVEFAGGAYSEAQLGMLLLVLLAIVGVFGTALDDRHIRIDLFTHRIARRPLAVLTATAVIASAVGLVNGMAFAPRYAAVYFPLFLIVVALGFEQFRGRARDIVLVAFALTSLAGMFFVFRLDRSQAAVAADAIEAVAPSGVVVACPDQLGPSTARVLDRTAYDVTTYPRFDAPERVDWVDYGDRNADNDPAEFARQLLVRAEGRPIFFVFRDDFLTLKGQCQRVLEELAASRPPRTIVRAVAEDFYESMTVVVLEPAGR